MPTAPPISTPNDLLIKKYAPPPFTGALVAMDAMDSEVRKVMDVPKVTMINVPISPTLPTTHPKRKYMITPSTVRMEGVKTPPNVFNRFAVYVGSFLIINSLIYNYRM